MYTLYGIDESGSCMIEIALQRCAVPWRRVDAASWADGEGSDEVRRFIIENALMWLSDHHVDGLRLDAVHALVDHGAVHVLEELAERVDVLSSHLGRPLTLIAESDLNDPRIIRPREAHGVGITAQWNDDFHHAVHVAVSGETVGYYADFEPLTVLRRP